MASTCCLCKKLSHEVRFHVLLDVNFKDIQEWSLNIIELKNVEKLCVTCCRNLCVVGELLFQWRNQIRISLDSAKNLSNESLGKRIFLTTEGSSRDTAKVDHETGSYKAGTENISQISDDLSQPTSSTKQMKEKNITIKMDKTRDETQKRKYKTKRSKEKNSKLKRQNGTFVPICPNCDGECICKSEIGEDAEKSKIEASSTDFKCKNVTSLAEMEGHTKKVHNVHAVRRPCPHCEGSYYNLKNHMSLAHGISSTDQQLLCSFCPKTFSHRRITHLVNHERIHTNEKPFTCKVCGKGFSNLQKLSVHAATHTGEKKHKCRICGKRFAQNNNMITHERSIHKTVQLPCPNQCGKYFIWPAQIKKHVVNCTHNKSQT